MSNAYYMAFWNLENLFDVADSPRRSEKLQRAIGNSVRSWTQDLLDRKIAQLATIISRMNGGLGPDLLGVCEVENAYVMELLVAALAPLGRNYQVVHHDMSDHRGIDVAFIYDGEKLTAEELFSHFVMRRTATRDILQVNFRTRRDRLLVIIGNHWPSRSGGEMESAGYRAIAGETLAYFHQRIMEVHGKRTPVLALGDFNDEPFDDSVVRYALSTHSKAKVSNARSPRFYNMMWEMAGKRIGTYYYNNFPNLLDQALVNKYLLVRNAPLRVVPQSAEILRFSGMVSGGAYPTPIRFGGMGKTVNPDGYSDHFPIAVAVIEKEQP